MARKIYFFLRRALLKPFLLSERLFIKLRYRKAILIVLANKIGDFIIFSPSLHYIHEAYPDYALSVVTDKSVLALARTFPEIDEFIPLDTKKFQFNPFYALRVAKQLRKKAFSTVLYPAYSRSFTGDELVHMAGARERVAFEGDSCNLDGRNREKDGKWFTRIIKESPDFTEDFSEVGRYRYFCEQIDAKIDGDFVPHIPISSADGADGMRILKENGWNGGKYAVVAPGAGLRYRSWPTDKFAKVVEYLMRNDLQIIFSGGKFEQDLYDAIAQKTSGGPFVNLMGKTALPQLGGILQNAIMYFGSDTGTVHLAAAVGTPVVCLLGGGHFGRFFPYGDLKRNRIVYDKHMTCKYDNWACARTVPPGQPAPCIAGITVEDAIAEVDDLLKYIEAK
jgi:ADP-heptose:LPS heptosyltransferase